MFLVDIPGLRVRRGTARAVASGCCALLLFTGRSGSADNNSTNATEKTRACFQCNGTGEAKCTHAGCHEGKVDCPGPCVKASGKWEKRAMPGYDPNELWQKVRLGAHSYTYVSRAHIGQYFTAGASGEPVAHRCEVCHGHGLVNCPVCKGTGKVVCPVCDGKKVVPESWSAFDNPRMKNRPAHFKLKDGTLLVGYKVFSIGDRTTIQTEHGKVDITTTEIVLEEQPASER